MLGIKVHSLELFIILEVKGKWIFFGRLTAMSTGVHVTSRHAASLCIFAPVKLQVALCVNSSRLCLEPEVNKVEVVGRLVHKKASAVPLVTVPAAKVVSTVVRVQHPLEMNTCDLPDGTGTDDLGDLGVVWRISVVEGDADLESLSQ